MSPICTLVEMPGYWWKGEQEGHLGIVIIINGLGIAREVALELREGWY